MFRERIDYSRAELIARLARQHLPPDQIDYHLERLLAERRGRISECNVERALKEAPYVLGVKRTEHFSLADRSGIDIFVYFHEINPFHMSSVRAQIKSSQGGIDQFWIARLGIQDSQDEDKRIAWQTERRLVIINGRLPDRKVRQAFFKQVREIAWNLDLVRAGR